MRPGRFAEAAVLVAVAGCGGGEAAPGRELETRLVVATAEVEFGKGFPLAVVRRWDRDLEPAAWSDDSLAPLLLRPVGIETREDGRRVEETRRFLAFATTLEEVRVPAPRISATPKAGGATRSAAGEGLALRVRSTLDPKSPGPPETPGALLGAPRRTVGWWIVAAIAAALGSALLLRRRRAVEPLPAPAAPVAPAEPPSARANRRFDALAAREPADAAALLAWHEEAAAILREWLREERGIATEGRTTPEIAGAAETRAFLGDTGATALAGALAECDLAKFARALPDAAARGRTLAAARAAVASGARS